MRSTDIETPTEKPRGRGLRRAYQYTRLTAYACGLLGALLWLWGRRGMGRTAQTIAGIGGALLVAMFLLFVVSYVLALSGSLRRRTGPRG